MTLHQQSSRAKCEERNTFVVSWLSAPNLDKRGFFIVIGDIDCDHTHFIRAWKISQMWSLTTILIAVSLIPQPGVTGIGTSNKVGFGETFSWNAQTFFCQSLWKSEEVLNMDTCYECTHGLSEEETYQLHSCSSSPTVSVLICFEHLVNIEKVTC